MKYQALTIENFRGIAKLEIADLRRVNLLVGRNNCGKTSILEAIFLLSGMASPHLSLNIHSFRDLILTEDEDFAFMFRNLDFSIPIRLRGGIEACERTLTVTPIYGSHPLRNGGMPAVSQMISVSTAPTISTALNHRIVEGINYDFVINGDKKHHGEIHIEGEKTKIFIPGDYKEDLTCSFLHPKSANMVDDKQMENLLIQKRLHSVITILKEIVPMVQDIRMGARSMVYVDIGAERLVPLNVMGDGMRKILTFLAAAESMKNGLLLIDEIENGLHYSSQSIAWKALFAACKEYNVQIIVTTHSYECVQAFSKTYDAFDPEGDDICLFRIEREGETHRAIGYDAEVLRAGLEKGFELR